MTNHLLFDFVVNKQTNTVTVTREFDANLSLTWDAWTKAELLDQWWAPEPYKSKTKFLDFKDGGQWLYTMVSPENSVWNRIDYKRIYSKVSYSFISFFSDEQGTRNTDFPSAQWNVRFNESGEYTSVTITIQFNSLADLETIIQMGFKEGFPMALNNLETLLQKMTNKKP